MKRRPPRLLPSTVVVLVLGLVYLAYAIWPWWYLGWFVRLIAALAGAGMTIGAGGILARRPWGQQFTLRGLQVITPLAVLFGLGALVIGVGELLRYSVTEPLVVALGTTFVVALHVYALRRFSAADVGEYLWSAAESGLGKSKLELDLEREAAETDR